MTAIATAIIAFVAFVVGIMVGLELYPDQPKPPQEILSHD